MTAPLLIVNPSCGSRREARGVTGALARVEAVLGDTVIRFTTRRGHARELAREAVGEGYQLIVAVGGDGTLSEVANGVLEASAGDGKSEADDVPTAAVGVIDVGTGGDFRRSLGIAPGLDACVEALASGRERLVDVGRARFAGRAGLTEERYFLNVLSAGLGGLVDRYIERLPSFLGGRAGYYLAALGAVAASKERRVQARITWEGVTREEVIPAYLIAVCNGRWFGGGMDVAPMALLDDDRLEVITITAPNKPYLADRVRGVYTGRHLQEPTVHHFPCRRIELRLESDKANRRFPLDVDGEALGFLPLSAEVLPRRLRVRG